MNNRKRVFVSISLLDSIKEDLNNFKENYKDLPIKWLNIKNLHITLFFIGYLNKEKTEIIIKEIEKIILNYNKFLINLINISYYPKEREKANYIWVNIEKTEELVNLNKDIKEILLKNNIKLIEEKEFLPHITLGKINKTKWKSIDLEEIPIIEEDIDINLKVDNIEIVESKLNKKESNYIVLERIELR